MHFLLHKILKVHVHLRRIAMFLNKVEICGVNTSELPLLSDEEKENLFIQIEQGNMMPETICERATCVLF